MSSLDLVSADEASARLGISRASLYAYVSRGLIRSFASPHDPRQRLYAADDAEPLVRRRTRFRRPAAAAATALDWGLPVLETGLSQIKDGRLFYRGVDAVDLSRTATLEEAARLLVGGLDEEALAAAGPACTAPGPLPFMARAIRLLSEPASEPPGRPGAEVAAILRLVAAAGSGTAAGAGPIHADLATAWAAPPEAADAIRRALVLCADHELSTSAFAVRVTASTGASLRHAVVAGLCALSGPLHGGATDHVRAFLEEWEAGEGAADPAARIATGRPAPSFHHPLYPAGDPRGAALLDGIPLRACDAALLDALGRTAGGRATIDAALVMTERAYGLPRGAAFALFAIGRTAGWLAHAVEQRRQGSLIRPRARYVVTEEDRSA